VRRLKRPGVILGLVIAFALPLANLIVANLGERGIVVVDPDGAVIQALKSTFAWEIFLGPLGILIVGSSAGVRSLLGWSGLILVAIPVLGFLWFLGVAMVGGLSGSPF
jgi:hypothetical protein